MQGSLFGAALLDQVGDAAEFGLHPRGDHEREAASLRNDGAHVAHVATVAERQVIARESGGLLLHGFGFARQRGFLNAEIDRFEQAHVRGQDVARLELEDVAWDEISRGEGNQLPVADDAHFGHGKFLQRGDGLFGAIFLHESEDRIQQDDGSDGDGVLRVAEQASHDRGRDEDENHRGGDLLPEDFQRGASAFFDEFVAAILNEALLRLVLHQAFFLVRAQIGQGFLDFEQMPIHCRYILQRLFNIHRFLRQKPGPNNRQAGAVMDKQIADDNQGAARQKERQVLLDVLADEHPLVAEHVANAY